MKILHGDGYTKAEYQEYKYIVHDNLVLSMLAVLKAMMQLRINLDDQANRVHVKTVLTATPDDKRMLPPRWVPPAAGLSNTAVVETLVWCF